MISLRGTLRRQSLRTRITLTFVAISAALALVLALGTFFAVRTLLESQRIGASTRQTLFGLLFAREFVGTDPGRTQRAVSLLQTREGLDAMITAGDTWFSTSIALTPESIPPELAALVAEEKLGYQSIRLSDDRVLVYGAPLPPTGVDLYLFYSLADLDRTLSLLARVLSALGLIAVLVAGVLAQRASKRILQPLVAVSAAAQQVAEGLLETRVAAPSDDEVGRLAASFNEMASALERMILRERRFVANVSHELRTPLATLEATADLLAGHRDDLSPPGREAIDLVVQDVTGLRQLVEELMEISELDSGRAAVRWEQLDLRALAEAVADKRRRQVRVEGPAIVTYADKARIHRIVGNLLDNAFQHGEGRDVRVAVWAEDSWCGVAVSDRGPGVGPGDAPLLFHRFYKADRSRTRERGGVGLGLSIALDNAKLLGGTIDVASSLGGGATFTLRLPMRREAPEGSG